jgi:K(+)-stimulated pyrophosphate-energized sodium pump
MGADLFESYVEAIISAMLIGLVVLGGGKYISFPMIIAGLGILASIVGILMVKGKKPATAMNTGTFISAGLIIVLSLLASHYMLRSLGPFYATTTGLVAGLIIGLTTQYFTSYDYKPVRSLAEDAKTGPATVIISGMSLGMMSTVIPIVVVAIAIMLAYYFMSPFAWPPSRITAAYTA